ncbi:MAG: kelch repeat-containing protein [Gemmatimonadaceae bacterium]
MTAMFASALRLITSVVFAFAGTMVSGANMSVPRAAHTATTLKDGRVLVAGGFIDKASVASGAQLFNPATERYGATGHMRNLRHSHSATLLANGKVLIVGGYGEGNATTASAELFDPATNAFTATGSLHTPRAGHVAVLLNTGKVLITGGVGTNWTFLASGELYDPVTGTFSATGDMTVARESHAAIRLNDGRVLVAGGHRGRRADITLFASAEVYDASTEKFRRVGDMQVRRHKHDAVLLRDGRVMITGGSDERDDRGVYNTTEFFDAKSETFTAGPAMQHGRYKHIGTMLQLPTGAVLLAGGAPQAETYDAGTNTFVTVGGDVRMAGQFSAAAMLSDGRVLITGGYGNGTGPRASSWLYRP